MNKLFLCSVAVVSLISSFASAAVGKSEKIDTGQIASDFLENQSQISSLRDQLSQPAKSGLSRLQAELQSRLNEKATLENSVLRFRPSLKARVGRGPVTVDESKAGSALLTRGVVQWELVSKPLGSGLTDHDILVDPSNPRIARFSPDRAGTYVVGLFASNGDRSGTPLLTAIKAFGKTALSVEPEKIDLNVRYSPTLISSISRSVFLCNTSATETISINRTTFIQDRDATFDFGDNNNPYPEELRPGSCVSKVVRFKLLSGLTLGTKRASAVFQGQSALDSAVAVQLPVTVQLVDALPISFIESYPNTYSNFLNAMDPYPSLIPAVYSGGSATRTIVVQSYSSTPITLVGVPQVSDALGHGVFTVEMPSGYTPSGYALPPGGYMTFTVRASGSGHFEKFGSQDIETAAGMLNWKFGPADSDVIASRIYTFRTAAPKTGASTTISATVGSDTTQTTSLLSSMFDSTDMLAQASSVEVQVLSKPSGSTATDLFSVSLPSGMSAPILTGSYYVEHLLGNVPNHDLPVTLDFKPDVAGSYTAKIVVHFDGGIPDFEMAVTATGL